MKLECTRLVCTPHATLARKMLDALRLDKWLWAARFYKTRSLATAAINSGKALVGGHVAKPSRALRVGERVSLLRGPYQRDVDVLALSDKRGPAKVAEALYAETAESQLRRQQVAQEIKVSNAEAPRFEGRGRPTKKDRRDLMRVVGKSARGPSGGRKD